MSEINLKDFQNKKKKLHEQKDAVEETIEVKRKNMKTEAENVETLSQISNSFEVAIDMYSDVDENQVNQMGNKKYKIFTRPLSDLVASGSTIIPIRDQSINMSGDIERHNAILVSTGSATSSTTSAFEAVSMTFPQSFPNGQLIIEKYKPREKLESQISYIKKQLSAINPDVHKDFEIFLQKFYAFGENKTKYQDLIGCRSILFLRLIFGFSEKTYGTKTRNEQIKRFVFGKTPYDNNAEPIIKNARNLWDELSNQDSTGNSIKLGRVSDTYIDVLFPRIIGIIASLLKLREKYFSP